MMGTAPAADSESYCIAAKLFLNHFIKTEKCQKFLLVG
jgi:hypothetical protein